MFPLKFKTRRGGGRGGRRGQGIKTRAGELPGKTGAEMECSGIMENPALGAATGLQPNSFLLGLTLGSVWTASVDREVKGLRKSV